MGVGEDDRPTINELTVEPNPVGGLLQVHFTAADAGGLALAHLRRNGDNIGEMTLSGVTFAGTFATPHYTPGEQTSYSVVVFDIHGNGQSYSIDVTPNAGFNRAPVPFVKIPVLTVSVGQSITLDATRSSDADHDDSTLTVEWDLDGDGSFDTSPTTTKTLVTRFNQSGTRRIVARVTDPAGAQSVSTPVALSVQDNGSPTYDFGDAPDPRYPTLLASGGARHVVGELFLGAGVDADVDGQPNATATGDDTLDGGNDDDGVVWQGGFLRGQSMNIQVTSSAGGVLNYFFDFNNDGSFGNNSNEVFAAVLDGGVAQVPVVVPPDAVLGATFARFRLSSAGGLGPTGLALDGEVEDYSITVVDPSQQVGVHRSNRFYLDVNGNGLWDRQNGDRVHAFGNATDVPIVGDWNGDGYDEIGVHRGNRFYLDVNGDGSWNAGNATITFGVNGDTPIIGDWNGDGIDDIGVHRGNRFILDFDGNRRWDSARDLIHSFGNPTDTPIVGDWTGGGADLIGVHRGYFFYLDVTGNGRWDAADRRYAFGSNNDTPIVGDWNGDGLDEIGVHRRNRFYLDADGNGSWTSIDTVYSFGTTGNKPIIGKWQPPMALRVAGGATAQTSGSPLLSLTSAQLAPIVAAAIDVYTGAGLSASQLETLSRVKVLTSNLEGPRLGQAIGTTITIDVNAAGHGWFIDVTPHFGDEFRDFGDGPLVAASDSAASGQVDLLTVVLHELGHVLGLDDEKQGNSLMCESLGVGTRRLPSEGELAELLLD